MEFSDISDNEVQNVLGKVPDITGFSNDDPILNYSFVNGHDEAWLNELVVFGNFSFLALSECISMMNAFIILDVYSKGIDFITTDKTWFHPLVKYYKKYGDRIMPVPLDHVVKNVYLISKIGWNQWVNLVKYRSDKLLFIY